MANPNGASSDIHEDQNKNANRLFKILVLVVCVCALGVSAVLSPVVNTNEPFKSMVYHILISISSALIGFIAARYVVGVNTIETIDSHTTETMRTIAKSTEELTTIINAQKSLDKNYSSEMKNLSEEILSSKNFIKSLSQQIGLIDSRLETLGPKNILDDINFDRFIEESKEIFLMVQSWGNWVEAHEAALKKFFNNGGKFILTVVDPDSRNSSHQRELMEKRLGCTPTQVVDDIEKTINDLKIIKDNSSNEACELIINKMHDINWYFGARFKSSLKNQEFDKLVLSVYGHIKQGSPKNLPAMLIDLRSQPATKNWFEKELESLSTEKELSHG